MGVLRPLVNLALALSLLGVAAGAAVGAEEGTTLEPQATSAMQVEAADPQRAVDPPPADAPMEVPAEKPAVAPAEKPAEAPMEVPAEKPAVAPAEKPAEAPMEGPAEKPAKAPAEAPSEDETRAEGVGEGEGESEGKGEGAQPEGRVLYHGAQLLRLTAEDEEQQRAVDRLVEEGEVEVWKPRLPGDAGDAGDAGADVLVLRERLEGVRRALEAARVHTQVVIEDLQAAIDAENTLVSEEELDELQGRYGHRMEWQSYHALKDIHQFLDFLAETYPSLVSVSSIGASEGGRALKMLKIAGDRPDAPAIWVDGGIHAREWVSPAAVTYLINELVLNREQHGRAAQAVTWYVLAVVNPDGYEHSRSRDRLWRKNRRAPAAGSRCPGVDLNRNFGYKWGGAGSSRRPCDEIYAGSQAFSEPETAAIARFVKATPNIKAYLSFHSYGQYVLYPWGYARSVPPDHEELRRVGDKMARAMRQAAGGSYRVGPAGATLYPAAGGSDDWAKGAAGVKYTYTVELRDQGSNGFVLPAHLIEPTAKEALAAARTLAEELAPAAAAAAAA